MLTPPRAPHGICVALCDLWENSPICFFKRIGRLVVSHRSLRFADELGLRRVSCSLKYHPAWHLCCSVRSVGEFSHLLFQAHWALSCLPQISQICTDADSIRMRKIRAHPSRRRRIKSQAVGSGARVNDP